MQTCCCLRDSLRPWTALQSCSCHCLDIRACQNKSQVSYQPDSCSESRREELRASTCTGPHNGMQQDARLPSRFYMGGEIEGGATFSRSNCQFPYCGRHSVYCSKGSRPRGLGERTYAGYIPDSNARLLDPGLATAAGLCRESVVFNVSTHVHIFIVSRHFSFSHTTLDLSTHHATATVPQVHPCRHSITACWMDSTCQ